LVFNRKYIAAPLSQFQIIDEVLVLRIVMDEGAFLNFSAEVAHVDYIRNGVVVVVDVRIPLVLQTPSILNIGVLLLLAILICVFNRLMNLHFFSNKILYE
jgi:hypothetical protein